MRYFNEPVMVYLPAGTKASIAMARKRFRIGLSDYVRQALYDRLEADGLPVPAILEQRCAFLPVRRESKA